MLTVVAEYFDHLSAGMGIEAVITRVWNRYKGESGVHPAKRAIDFRDETFDGPNHHFLYSPDQALEIVTEMNLKFPRHDGKLVCMHHSFQCGPYHFHVQIPAVWMKL